MNDLIYREQAIRIASGYCHPTNIADELAKLPSAEKTGKWEYIGGYGYQYRCSVCLRCAEFKTNYCPNCGSRMGE